MRFMLQDIVIHYPADPIGVSGRFRLGIATGPFSLKCCRKLTLPLFVEGVRNQRWIAALTILVLLERLTPFGLQVRRRLRILAYISYSGSGQERFRIFG